jgi:hypothetical protein
MKGKHPKIKSGSASFDSSPVLATVRSLPLKTKPVNNIARLSQTTPVVLAQPAPLEVLSRSKVANPVFADFVVYLKPAFAGATRQVQPD